MYMNMMHSAFSIDGSCMEHATMRSAFTSGAPDGMRTWHLDLRTPLDRAETGVRCPTECRLDIASIREE